MLTVAMLTCGIEAGLKLALYSHGARTFTIQSSVLMEVKEMNPMNLFKAS